MGYKVLAKCPVCSANLKITRLACRKCNTIIENEFDLPVLLSLSDEELSFVEVFLKCRGNIKDVEKELGISYPTVRAKLDEVITSLGYSVVRTKTVPNNEVLDMLEKGEISAEQAIKMLND
jgi:hypothetical protein